MNTIRYRKRQRTIIAHIGFIVAVTVFTVTAFGMFFWNNYQMDDQKLAAQCPKEIDGVPMTTDFVPVSSRARTGDRRKILYIVIHETDNTAKGADAKAHNHFIHENGKETPLSWHYTVDDTEIYHHIPDGETAFHAGDSMKDGGGNQNGIGIEMCVNKDGNYEKTLKNSAKLVAYLLNKYNLKIEDIKKHQDFNGKMCPSILIKEGRWEEFLEIVQTELTK